MQRRNAQRGSRIITSRPRYITGLRIVKLEAFENALKNSMDAIATAKTADKKRTAVAYANRKKEWFARVLDGWINRGELNEMQLVFAKRLKLLTEQETNNRNLADIYKLTCSLKEGVF